MSGKYYTVGKLVNTHGIRGDVKVLPQTDFADQRFARGSKLLLVNDTETEAREVTVLSAREQKGLFYIKFSGMDNINDVEKYKGWDLKVSEQEQEELEDGQYYYHEIIGCKVILESQEEFGVITEILSPGANDVWVVERPKEAGKPVLLPVIDEVVLHVDKESKVVTVRLLEGLI